MKREVFCPYCGTKVSVEHDSGAYSNSYLVCCDVMEGGCDKLFVVDVKVSVSTKTRKIEGEADAE